jgi:hypothetical protein
MTPTPTDKTAETTPWYRLPIVWMVILGPALVVVASFVTLTLAIIHPDPVYTVSGSAEPGEAPAEQARNHAASPKH